MGQLGRDVGTESVFSFLKMADVTTYQYTDGTRGGEHCEAGDGRGTDAGGTSLSKREGTEALASPAEEVGGGDVGVGACGSSLLI